MRLKWLFFGFLVVSVQSPLVVAEKIVTIATLHGYPPYTFYKEDVPTLTRELVPPGTDAQSLQGFSWDVVRESFHAMGYTLDVSITPWLRAMHNLESGKADLLFPAGRNLLRDKVYAYPEEPVNEVQFLIYTRADSPVSWDGLASFNGLTVGIMNGYNYGDDWNNHEGIIEQVVLDMENGFRLLALGRIDGFAGYETSFDYTLSQLGDIEEFRKLPSFGASREYVVGMRDNPAAESLLEVFDEGKASIVADGTYEHIFSRWHFD